MIRYLYLKTEQENMEYDKKQKAFCFLTEVGSYNGTISFFCNQFPVFVDFFSVPISLILGRQILAFCRDYASCLV